LNDDAPKWSYSGEELAIGLVQAHLGSGRPATQSAFEAEGLDRPGSVRTDRILKLMRDAHQKLTAMNWQLINHSN